MFKYNCQIVIMKIRERNGSTNADLQSNNNSQKKYSKIAIRQNVGKSKNLVQKQNIVPYDKNIGMKKSAKQANKSTTVIKKQNSSLQLQEYEKQIIKHLKSKQNQYRIASNYIRNHQHITSQHRSTFVKFFFKMLKKFRLRRETVFLAVFYMDFYFEKNLMIERREATIAAQACLFMAMKYQQIYPPDLCDWCQSAKQVVLAEGQIIKSLQFKLVHLTLQNCLQYLFSKLDISQRDKESIKSIADVSLFDQSLYKYGVWQLSASMIYSIINRSKLQQKMQLSLKWMLQRNQKHMLWLQTFKISSK